MHMRADPLGPCWRQIRNTRMYQDHSQYASTSHGWSTMNAAIAPLDTTHHHDPQQQQQQQQQQQHLIQQQQANANATPLVASGDWTKDLVHLAKTAELKYVPYLRPKVIDYIPIQETRVNPPTPYCAHTFRACIPRTKK